MEDDGSALQSSVFMTVSGCGEGMHDPLANAQCQLYTLDLGRFNAQTDVEWNSGLSSSSGIHGR